MQAHDLFETPLDQAEIDFENEGGEIFVCGNPPYIGGKTQNAAQKSDMKAIFANEPKFKNLDYICAFLVKTGIYLQYYDRAAIVTTNSISQGTHVPVLWPILEKLGCIVEFSYETFKWQNNAQNNAGVSVTIVGLTRHLVSEKFIYNDQSRRKVTNINAYLIDGPQVIVESESKPINSLSPMITGNAAYDGGNLFLNSMEAKAISQRYPVVSKSIRPVTGTSEFIDGILRYCLWIDDQDLTEFMQFPEIAERIEKVRKAREDGGEVAITLVDRSHQFRFRNTSKRLQIVVPQVSSEKREYLGRTFK